MREAASRCRARSARASRGTRARSAGSENRRYGRPISTQGALSGQTRKLVSRVRPAAVPWAIIVRQCDAAGMYSVVMRSKARDFCKVRSRDRSTHLARAVLGAEGQARRKQASQRSQAVVPSPPRCRQSPRRTHLRWTCRRIRATDRIFSDGAHISATQRVEREMIKQSTSRRSATVSEPAPSRPRAGRERAQQGGTAGVTAQWPGPSVGETVVWSDVQTQT